MLGPGEGGLPFRPPQQPGERCVGRGPVCVDSAAARQPPEEGMFQGRAREELAG